MKHFLLVLIFISLSLISCNNEISEVLINNNSLSSIKFIDGRLKFTSEIEFQKFYYKNQEIDEDELYDLLKPFYQQGFRSLRPPMTEKNKDDVESLIIDRFINLPVMRNSEVINTDLYAEYIDELEELIACDVFSAFLNDSGEILIGNKIFKYTDVGLFTVFESNYEGLNNYLNSKNISNSPIILTDDFNRLNFNIENPVIDELPIVVSSGIQHFRVVQNQVSISSETQTSQFAENLNNFNGIGNGNTGGGGNTGTDGASNSYVPMVGLQSFVENLQPCNPNDGVLGSLFGVNKICFDNFTGDRRIRTKVWRHNYLLVYTLGTKVKNQRKNCLLVCWWYKTSNGASEIVKADEAIQFEYDFSNIYSSHQLNQAAINSNQNQVFFNRYDIEYEVLTQLYSSPVGTLNYTFVNSKAYPISNLLPIFRDDLVVGAFENNNLVDQAFGTLNSQLAANKLNELFWKGVWNSASKQLKSLTGNQQHKMPNRTTLVSFHPSFGKVIIQKTNIQNKLNTSKLSTIFDWGASFSIGLNSSGIIKPGIGDHLLSPSNVRFKVVGAAKVHGVWRGSKIIYNF